jgi:hypothetical protein
MEQELTRRVLTFAKNHSNRMREETAIESSIQEEDLKQYLQHVIREVKGKATANTKGIKENCSLHQNGYLSFVFLSLL